jgi:hypothetical protein
MCIYSLNIRNKVAKAVIGETLIKGKYQGHDVLTNETGALRCIRRGSVLQVERLDFDLEMLGRGSMVVQPDQTASRKQLTAWQGKRATVKLRHWAHGYAGFAADAFELPDGLVVSLGWLAEGTQFKRTRKVRKDKGVAKPRNLERVLKLDKRSLAQVEADQQVRQPEKVKG